MSAGTAVGMAFINAAVELGRSLGMRTIAEGIETVEQAQLARSLGCDHGQGYLWSASMPADAISDLLVSGNLPVDAAGQIAPAVPETLFSCVRGSR